MGKRHSGADPFLIDHVVELEALIDRNIQRLRVQEDKTKAVTAVPPLREKLHVQKFLGCTNFLRFYMPPQYSHCAKILGEYVKGTRAFPPEGLGPGTSEADRAVKAIKLMCQRSVVSILDEAAAIDGSKPLEQIADSSGYAVGGVALQMKERGLLSLEGFAQLDTRRAIKGMLGPFRGGLRSWQMGSPEILRIGMPLELETWKGWFSLGEYLDDEGEGTIIIPRSFLSDGAASAARAPPAAVKEEEVAVISTSVLAGLMKGAGVVPTSKEPPFEDFEGNLADFERLGKAKLAGFAGRGFPQAGLCHRRRPEEGRDIALSRGALSRGKARHHVGALGLLHVRKADYVVWLFGQCFRCMREEEKELNRVDKEKEEDSKAGLSVRVDKEKEEDSKAGLSVLKFTPEPLLPELTVGKVVLDMKTFVKPNWPVTLYPKDWRRSAGDEFWKANWERDRTRETSSLLSRFLMHYFPVHTVHWERVEGDPNVKGIWFEKSEERWNYEVGLQ
ncbi:POL [Symbiodinium sp. KB8]|nr:POL [Symbiodinium sp. KB8]